eukprot:745722-Hanusia_phi.AAC.3
MEAERTSEPSTEMCSDHNSDEEVDEKQVTKSDSVSVKVQVRNSRTTARSEPIEITYEQLATHFHRSLESAASSIGIGKSTMKVVCRRLGIKKWPYTHKGQRRRRPSKKLQASQSESAPSGDRAWLSEMGECAKPLASKTDEESGSEAKEESKGSVSPQASLLNPNLLSASEWAFLATCASAKANANAAPKN